ncbi:histidinol dehydrogenase [Pilibacter termitis]|uniref:Histidinol dehydrogenase n=1 Tax=Pilibacter termitis TaxID=263852 RepID=A0A1T4LPC6_9ENTE|nr:histidinol dehydrogenase [Pilibacter termitis]SJZ56570.1 histidinol dehydrogenase [Pilibacter termitis]
MKRLTGSVEEIADILKREQMELNTSQVEVENAVSEIIETVKTLGDKALIDYTEKFDGVVLKELQVGRLAIDHAYKEIELEVLVSLKQAKENIISYHEKQKELGFADFQGEGILRGQMIVPLERVGIYVPGGTAAYPSSVLMNALPAKIAGVEEIIMITPPPKDNVFNSAILVAADLAGVDKIFQIGGAHGIAALAYGTQMIPRVDKIVGPGNIFVATAKKQVFGQVGIDMIAGPSEVGVLADESANPRFIAADLLSQAEHDVLARAILVTNSEELATEVDQELERQLRELPREEIARASIENNGRTIITDTIEHMFELMNKVAPEHLEVQLEDSIKYLSKIKNAGSVFLGNYTSEPVGDYFAGANHVLPTGSTARFSSALGVHDFVKRIQYTYYDKKALKNSQRAITALARKEGLEAHARAIDVRFEA